MKDDPENLLEPREKTVFLSDISREGRKPPMPWLLVVVIVLALGIMLWKTAVRQPDNRKAALEAVIKRGEAEEALMKEHIRRQREEYLRTHPPRKNP